MKGFIIKIASFLLILTVLYYLVSAFAEKNHKIQNDFTGAIIDKHHHLDSIQTPKLIFQGGSNTAFGIDGATIEEEFKTPTVILGLQVSYGLTFMLEELKSCIKKDDVIFLSLEYFLSLDGDYKIKKLAGNFYPKAYTYYKKNIFKEIEYSHYIIKESIFRKLRDGVVEDVFIRGAFNEYGNVVAHIGKPNKLSLYGRDAVFEYNKKWEGVKPLNDFYEYVKEIGAQVYFIYPSYPKTEYEKNKKAIALLDADLKKNLKIKILNSPIDSVFDDDYFYDSVYHLDGKGGKIRTARLIEMMKNDKEVYQSLLKIAENAK